MIPSVPIFSLQERSPSRSIAGKSWSRLNFLEQNATSSSYAIGQGQTSSEVAWRRGGDLSALPRFSPPLPKTQLHDGGRNIGASMIVSFSPSTTLYHYLYLVFPSSSSSSAPSSYARRFPFDSTPPWSPANTTNHGSQLRQPRPTRLPRSADVVVAVRQENRSQDSANLLISFSATEITTTLRQR